MDELKRENAADDAAVQQLATRSAQKRLDARALYQQALADSSGKGVTHSGGCPAGGYCYNLVLQSRALDKQAAALDTQAGQLLGTQRADREARAAEQSDLSQRISNQRSDNSVAVKADAGFGARTAAMWHLVSSDFWGVGVFYMGITLLLVALDCAAVALKFASRGNAYERNEARVARRREHEAALIHEREIHDARNYGEAMAKVVASGIEAASHDEQVARASAARASAVLRTAVVTGEESPGLHKGNGVTGEKPALHAAREEEPAPAEPNPGATRNGRHRRPLRLPVVDPSDVRSLPPHNGQNHRPINPGSDRIHTQ
jgi:Domain of unknown function (DUF4407)